MLLNESLPDESFVAFQVPKQAAADYLPAKAQGIRRFGELLTGGRAKKLQTAISEAGPAAVKNIARERAAALKDLEGSAFHRVGAQYQQRMADAANRAVDPAIHSELKHELDAIKRTRLHTALGVGGTALVAAPAVYDAFQPPTQPKARDKKPKSRTYRTYE